MAGSRVGVAVERVYVVECTSCGVLVHFARAEAAREAREGHIEEHRSSGQQARKFSAWAAADAWAQGGAR